jgi:acyl carrier protein
MAMSRLEFLNQLAEILELPAGSLRGDEKLEDMNWTSLAMVSFIALADEHYGKNLSPRAFVKCETVGDLCDLAGAPA